MRRSWLESFSIWSGLALLLLLEIPLGVWLGGLAATTGVTTSTVLASLREALAGAAPSQVAPLAWAGLSGAAGGVVVSAQLVRADKRKRSRLRFQELSSLLAKTAEAGSDDLIPLARRIVAAGDGSADRFFEAGGAVHDQFRELKKELSVEHLPTLRWRDGEIFSEGPDERLRRIRPLLDDMRHQWPPNLGRINESLHRVLTSDDPRAAK
jgi:hypothetical protein